RPAAPPGRERPRAHAGVDGRGDHVHASCRARSSRGLRSPGPPARSRARAQAPHPARRPDVRAFLQGDAVTAGGDYRHVLLVEDDASLCQVIGRNLARRGLEVRTVPSVNDALRAVAQMRPDLLLLDINLPDRSGWELLRALHNQGIEIPTI